MRLLLLLLGLCGTGVLRAQAVADTLALPTVTVTATRTPVAPAEAPVRVTVVPVTPASGTVADLLEAHAPVHLRRYGSGGLATLSLRGAGASQTLVLLDGHRLADPQLGQLDVSLLPAVLLERADVVQGAASARYGSDGVGGVVNLRTLRADDRLRASVRAGAYGERGAALLLGRTLAADGDRRLGALLVLDHEQATGDYRFLDATRFNPATGRAGLWRTRENADLRRQTLYARLDAETPRTTTALGLWLGDAERGLFAFAGPTDARQWDRHLRLWTDHALRFAVPGSARTGTLRLGGLWQRAALRYADAALALDDTGRTDLLTTEATADFPLAATATLTVGGTLGLGRATHPSLTTAARETRAAAFASAAVGPARLRLFPAVRYDRDTRPAGPPQAAWSPQLGINLQPTAWPALRVKASAGRAFRTPTFNDRFWQPGGNPALHPERGWTADAGVVLDRRAPRSTLTLELTAFRHALRDQIVWQPTDAGFWAPFNLGRTRTVGFEASLDATARWGRTVPSAQVLYTHTDARDVTTPGRATYDQPLAYVPRHQARVTAGLGVGPLRIAGAGRWLGRRAVRADGSLHLPGVFVADVEAQATLRGWGTQATLALTLENAFNRSYEVMKGYPMPPRHLRAALVLGR